MSVQRKIIIAVDSSEFSTIAVKWAISNFLKPTDHVVVLNSTSYVFSDSLTSVDLVGEIAVPITSSDPVKEEQAMNESKQLVEEFLKLFEAEKISNEGALVRGDPGSQIIEWANKISADSIVVGSHGYGAFRRTLLGSISDYVLHNASVPVIIVRSVQQTDAWPSLASAQSRTIVIPVDNSSESAFAFVWALENVCTPADKVTILHVQNPSSMPSAISAGDLAMDDIYVPVSLRKSSVQLLGDSEKLVERFMEYANTQTKIHCEGKVVSGSMDSKVCEELTLLKADIAIVGSHNYGAIARTFLGSVSDYIVHNSPCPVIVAKTAKPKANALEEGGGGEEGGDHLHSG